MSSQNRKKGNLSLLVEKWRMRVCGWMHYVSDGIWEQPDDRWHVRFLKVVNLSVRSFTDRDLQSQAASLTYSTLLATVPVLAMLFAIARGFGFQNLLRSQLFNSLPAQKEVLENAFTFVEGYFCRSGSYSDALHPYFSDLKCRIDIQSYMGGEAREVDMA